MGAHLLPAKLAQLLRRRRAMGADWLATDAFRPFSQAPSPQDLAVAELSLPPVTDVASWCLAMTHASNLPMLLHWEDRNSMAHSIEARVPFLDHPLVEFSLALGNAHKFVGADTKRVLRRAMESVDLEVSVGDAHTPEPIHIEIVPRPEVDLSGSGECIRITPPARLFPVDIAAGRKGRDPGRTRQMQEATRDAFEIFAKLLPGASLIAAIFLAMTGAAAACIAS
jgi:hypothetical protein